MTRKLLLGLAAVLGSGAILLLLPRGDRVEQRLMRSGGRMVQMAVQRPSRTAKVFAAVVAVAWGGVAAGVLWQRLHRSVPRNESSRSEPCPCHGEAKAAPDFPADSGPGP